MNDKTIKTDGTVKTQTAVVLVCLALAIGFVGGIALTIYKLDTETAFSHQHSPQKKTGDRDGMLAQGYYTFADGPLEWICIGGLADTPPPRTFEGTNDMSPGMGIDMITMQAPGFVILEISEIPGTNTYLTSWQEFYIDPYNTIPGWMDDRASVDLEVI